MDRRKERRLDLEMPVRIWGVDRMSRPFAEIVRAGNVSPRGAVLTGVRAKIQVGELLDVQNGASQAQFRTDRPTNVVSRGRFPLCFTFFFDKKSGKNFVG